MATHVFTGTSDPATAPNKVSSLFHNTTSGVIFIAMGTTDSDDWVPYAGAVPIVDVSTTTYTITKGDWGRQLHFSHASGCTVTLPEQGTEALPARFFFDWVQKGAAQITFSTEGTDSIESLDSNTKSSAVGAPGRVQLEDDSDPNVWGLYGSLGP